jgi:glycosyltransferase involved in cell wall biosynthesis
MSTLLKPETLPSVSASAWQGRRIGIVLGALAAGSRERVIVGLAERLADAGAEVDLLIPGVSDAVSEDLAASIRHHDLSGRLTRNLPNIIRLALSPPKIAAYLRREKPDAILSLSIPPNLATLAAKRLAASATPVVLRQSNVMRIDGSTMYGHVDRRLRDRLMRWLYPHADAAIAVSGGVADNLHRAIGLDTDKIHAIANGVPIERIDSLARAASPHPWLDDPAMPVVLAVGRLVRKKGYPTLLRAFARLRQMHPARLIILGDGPERRMIERQRAALGLDNVVDLPGRTDNPFAYLARASLYVLSSTFEGMPSALIEALVCGCPAVSTDCPSGPSEILEDGRYGRLVPVADSDALADAMAATLDAPPPRARQRSRGLSFSAEKTVDAYLAVLEEICSRSAQGQDAAAMA